MANQNIQIDIDPTIYLAAYNRANREGKTIAEIVADFINQYAQVALSVASPSTSRSLAPAVPATPATYTVQRGDSLGRIANNVYGDARKYPLIQQANNISDPSRIWVGQVLVIPSLDGGSASPSPVAPPPATPAPPTGPSPTSTSLPVTPAPAAPPTATPPPLPEFYTPTPAPQPIVGPTPTPTIAGGAAKPSIRWVGSPNFNQRRSPTDITAITIHSTANSTLRGVIDWFNNPNAQVSAHYTIDKDGTIVQHVRDQDRAWHAGQSIWKGRASCNDYCLGIELVNLNNGADPYPESQHAANVSLCAYLCATYNISPDDIMGHLDIALPVGRKTDPRGYDLNRLRREVAARLGR
jgi:LysM repeat protein